MSLLKPRAIAVPAAVAVLAGAGLVTLSSNALFTDTDAVTGNVFTTGSVSIDATPDAVAITVPAMAPGDAEVAELNVANTGSLEQRYALSSTAVDADAKGLSAALRLTVKTGVTACTAAGFDATGTIVYGPAVLGTAGGTSLFGDPTTGAQAGDRVLAANSAEKLCFRVALPLASGDGIQDASTEATLNFVAEQTDNNA